jgi:2-haloacid dehalogenase
MTDLSKIKALTFDVGGTVFDWRGTIESELSRLASEQNADLDISGFATDWRRGMFQELARVRAGELPWMNADQIHRSVLDDVLAKHTAIELSDSGRDNLNDVWHRLNAWPDAAAVIEKLRSRYTVVVLTVLSWSIAVDCSRHNGISWDGILSCEFLGHYKPDAAAYQKGVSLLRLEPEQAMMVAAHAGDLQAAMKAGLHSAYVHRDGESFGIFGELDSAPEWDVNARDFAELGESLLA